MKKIVMLVLAVALVASANAAVLVDTMPANNQAGLLPDAGQTFTTGLLGADNQLSTIEIEGPQAGGGLVTYTLELWTDTDGDHSTWDPGVLVGTSTNSAVLPDGVVVTYNFSNELLSDNTVYGFTYTDGLGTRIESRMGLTNATAIADGTLFASGGQVFGDGFDTAMRITTIPEPATMVLLGLGGLLLRRRRA